MKLKQITIIGNSVALRIRPVLRATPREQHLNYGKLLEKNLNDENLWVVNNLGKTRWLVTEFAQEPDFYIRTFPDYYIINAGCVDAPNRDIPLWVADILFKRKITFLFKPIDFLYRHFIKKYFRSFLVYIRGKRAWTSKKRFKEYYEKMVSTLLKETGAAIIVLGINTGNDRIEKILPGTLENYCIYNKIIEDICKKYHLDFIDVSDLKSSKYFPDGVHYNLSGHQIIFDRVIKIIYKKENSKSEC